MLRFYRGVNSLLLILAPNNSSTVVKKYPAFLCVKESQFLCYRRLTEGESSRTVWSKTKLNLSLKFIYFICADEYNVFHSHLLLRAAATQSPEAYMDTGQVHPTQCGSLLGDELIWQKTARQVACIPEILI